jgi:hypothetical protein
MENMIKAVYGDFLTGGKTYYVYDNRLIVSWPGFTYFSLHDNFLCKYWIGENKDKET